MPQYINPDELFPLLPRRAGSLDDISDGSISGDEIVPASPVNANLDHSHSMNLDNFFEQHGLPQDILYEIFQLCDPKTLNAIKQSQKNGFFNTAAIEILAKRNLKNLYKITNDLISGRRVSSGPFVGMKSQLMFTQNVQSVMAIIASTVPPEYQHLFYQQIAAHEGSYATLVAQSVNQVLNPINEEDVFSSLLIPLHEQVNPLTLTQEAYAAFLAGNPLNSRQFEVIRLLCEQGQKIIASNPDQFDLTQEQNELTRRQQQFYNQQADLYQLHPFTRKTVMKRNFIKRLLLILVLCSTVLGALAGITIGSWDLFGRTPAPSQIIIYIFVSCTIFFTLLTTWITTLEYRITRQRLPQITNLLTDIAIQ